MDVTLHRNGESYTLHSSHVTPYTVSTVFLVRQPTLRSDATPHWILGSVAADRSISYFASDQDQAKLMSSSSSRYASFEVIGEPYQVPDDPNQAALSRQQRAAAKRRLLADLANKTPAASITPATKPARTTTPSPAAALVVETKVPTSVEEPPDDNNPGEQLLLRLVTCRQCGASVPAANAVLHEVRCQGKKPRGGDQNPQGDNNKPTESSLDAPANEAHQLPTTAPRDSAAATTTIMTRAAAAATSTAAAGPQPTRCPPMVIQGNTTPSGSTSAREATNDDDHPCPAAAVAAAAAAVAPRGSFSRQSEFPVPHNSMRSPTAASASSATGSTQAPSSTSTPGKMHSPNTEAPLYPSPPFGDHLRAMRMVDTNTPDTSNDRCIALAMRAAFAAEADEEDAALARALQQSLAEQRQAVSPPPQRFERRQPQSEIDEDEQLARAIQESLEHHTVHQREVTRRHDPVDRLWHDERLRRQASATEGTHAAPTRTGGRPTPPLAAAPAANRPASRPTRAELKTRCRAMELEYFRERELQHRVEAMTTRDGGGQLPPAATTARAPAALATGGVATGPRQNVLGSRASTNAATPPAAHLLIRPAGASVAGAHGAARSGRSSGGGGPRNQT